MGLSGGSVRNRRSSPGYLAGVRSRQAVGSGPKAFPVPPGGSVTALMPCRSGHPVRFAEAPLSVRPSRPLSKRPTGCVAARCICGSPDSDRSHPEACFPTLLRASLPDLAVRFPFPFQPFPASSSSAVSPSRWLEAAPPNRVAQAESCGFIHRSDESSWTSLGMRLRPSQLLQSAQFDSRSDREKLPTDPAGRGVAAAAR